jgi:opacity protein-like surface antigen
MKIQTTLRAASAVSIVIFATFGAAASEDNHFAGGYAVLTQEWKIASAAVDGEKLKKSEAAPSIGIGYNFALDAHTTMGIKYSFDTKNGEYGVSSDKEVKEKSHYAIAVEPGYAVSDKTLVFGILAYHKGNAEYIAAESSMGSAHLTGFGYGVGAKYALANHLFLIGEVQKIDYTSKTIVGSIIKPAATVLALGVGYHF